MNDQQPPRTIGVRISYIARMLRTRFDARARSMQLTRAQWQGIAVVRFNPGVTQREMAEKLEIGSVAAGRLVERLEVAGWLERRPDPADRRAYRLHLAPNSGPMFEQLSALGQDEEARALAGLDEGECQLLRAMLDRIISNLAGSPRVRPDCLDE